MKYKNIIVLYRKEWLNFIVSSFRLKAKKNMKT